MKTALLALFICLSCQGCAWVTTHATQIGLVGTVAGSIAAVEGATLNTIHLVEEVKK